MKIETFALIRTLSLFSFLLMMTAVICWSMKIRMTPRSAGKMPRIADHHGLWLKGWIIQPLFGKVGLNSWGTWSNTVLESISKDNILMHFKYCLHSHIRRGFIQKCHLPKLEFAHYAFFPDLLKLGCAAPIMRWRLICKLMWKILLYLVFDL